MNQQNSFLNRELPEKLADQFATTGRSRTPTTMGERSKLAPASLVERDGSTGLKAMCAADYDRYEASFRGKTWYFHAVLDTLPEPFLVDAEETINIGVTMTEGYVLAQALIESLIISADED